ncbi:hypothetical protein BDV96DRAFT_651606 [Lophiotrema nucula]|uniref:Uncharacterized protein n=1 Tax=Lophiotrema nucula TaxID=690887 RepID=A0A6A5YR62_9PLEO|nr:hypothetical protein BDV96DRAFT_651606 [Lophiotrema nucula]
MTSDHQERAEYAELDRFREKAAAESNNDAADDIHDMTATVHAKVEDQAKASALERTTDIEQTTTLSSRPCSLSVVDLPIVGGMNVEATLETATSLAQDDIRDCTRRRCKRSQCRHRHFSESDEQVLQRRKALEAKKPPKPKPDDANEGMLVPA